MYELVTAKTPGIFYCVLHSHLLFCSYSLYPINVTDSCEALPWGPLDIGRTGYEPEGEYRPRNER